LIQLFEKFQRVAVEGTSTDGEFIASRIEVEYA